MLLCVCLGTACAKAEEGKGLVPSRNSQMLREEEVTRDETRDMGWAQSSMTFGHIVDLF
jgi:hypothetical protein